MTHVEVGATAITLLFKKPPTACSSHNVDRGINISLRSEKKTLSDGIAFFKIHDLVQT